MDKQGVRVWDLPTRLFHWALALAVVAAVVTGQMGGNRIETHGKIGLFILGLLVFRLVWGVLGSTYARFAQFFPTPSALCAYLKGQWRGLGHNPLGALSVFALLGILLLQVGTGLFANDDIAFTGPLFALIGKSLSNRLTGLHKVFVNILFVLVAVHVAAIIFYQRVKKEALVKAMVTGVKPEAVGEAARGGGWLAFIVALAIAAGTVYVASGALLESAPPPAAVPTPAW